MRSIFQRLLITYAAIMLVTIGVLAILLSHFLTEYYFSAKEKQLLEKGEHIRELVAEYKAGKVSQKEMEYYVNGIAEATGARIKAVSLNQSIEPGKEELKGQATDRFYDIKKILAGENIVLRRKLGSDQNMDVVLVGMPVKDENGKVDGVLLLASPLTEMRNTIDATNKIIFSITAIFMVLSVFFIYGTAKRITRPVIQVSEAAVRMAEGCEEPDVDVEGQDEIRRLADSFNYMKNRLTAIEQMRKDLLANVSHELRTPLTSIGGFVQAILDGKVKREEQDKYLRLAYQETQRLTRLVNDLLLLAQVQAGSLELRYQAFSMADVVEEVLQGLELELSARGIDTLVNIEPDVPPVHGDRDRVKQIVLNIISNSIRYTPSGGLIEITSKIDGRFITTSIKDTGSGIPEDELEWIFAKFYRTNKARSPGGTGLGLNIVKHLVELHGGKVYAESQLGQGTVITFTLPAALTDF